MPRSGTRLLACRTMSSVHPRSASAYHPIARLVALMAALAAVLAGLVSTPTVAKAGVLPVISCTSNPNLFNTGYNAATGGILPNNALDANWTVAGPFNSGAETSPNTHTSLPPGATVFAATNVGSIAPAAYSPSPFGNAQWISQQTIASPVSPEGDWYYEYQFSMDPSVDVSTFNLEMNFMSDNEIATVFVNGVDQAPKTTGLPQDSAATDPYFFMGYKIANQSSTTLNHDWQAGTNTIIVQIKSGPPEEAFDAQWRPSAVCPVTLAATKSASPDPYVPGQTLTYTAQVTNGGLGNAYGVTVADTLPAALAGAGFTWTCAASVGSSCTASGAGNINDTVVVAAFGSVTYTVTGTVPLATSGNLSNTITATPGSGTPDAGCTPNCSATSVDPQDAPALTVVKSVTSAGPYNAVGQTITYQFVATNTGNVTLTSVGVNDSQTAPAGALASGPTCQSLATPSGACAGATTTLLAGQSATFTATYTIAQADLDNGSVADSATVSGRPPGCAAPGCATTSPASPVTTPTQTNSALTVVKSVTSVGPYNTVGQTITYRFVASNTGNVTLTSVGSNDTQTAPAGSLASGPTCQSRATPSAACAGATTTLAPGQTATFAATYTITQADLDNGSVSDSATTSGDPPGCAAPGCATTSTASPLTVDTQSNPGLSVAKSVTSVGPYNSVGQTITYQFIATNTGNVTMSAVGINDSQTAPAGLLTSGPTCQSRATPSAACSGATTTLAPGQTATFTATYTITQADLDNGSVHDSAAASGDPPGCAAPGCAITSAASLLTVGLTQSPALTVVKSVTSVGPYNTLGQTITYRFIATNTGNVTMSSVGINDTQTAPAGSLTSGPTCQSRATPSAACSGATTTLAPGQSATFSATYTITHADLDNGSVADSATTSGDPPGSAIPLTSAASLLTVDMTQSPALTVVKSVTSVGPYNTVGQTITYQFIANNTGNVTMSAVGINDSQTAPAGSLTTGPSCQSRATPSAACSGATTTLAPGQTATFTATYTITQADLDNGVVADSATASGDPPGCAAPGCATTSPGSPASVGMTQTPALTVVKSVTSTGPYDTLGQTITYRFVASNTGNVTLSSVGINDSQTAPAGSLATGPTCQSRATPSAACSGATTTLAPGQTATFAATYHLTQADLDNGSVADSATASGDPPGCAAPGCETTSPASPVTVDLTQSPAVTVATSSPTGTYSAVGNTIDYHYLVTNTGNVTLSSIAVVDTMSSPATQGNLSAINCPSSSLAPGANETCTSNYTVTQADIDNGSVTDSAVASGKPPGAIPTIFSSASGVTVDASQSPLVTVAKSSPTSTYAAVGDTISYNFLVTNTGNVTLSNISVNDTMTAPATPGNLSTITCPSSTLAPAATETCTATYTVTQADLDNGSVHNSATSSGTPPGSVIPVTSGSSGVTVDGTQSPALTVATSSPTPAYAAVGDTISYDYLVTNTGNVTISSIGVADTMASPATQGNLSVINCPSATLAPTANETCTATYTVTQADLDNGSVTDSAVASGSAPGPTPVTSGTSGVVVNATQSPALTIAKSSPTANYSAVGNTIDYNYLVTNTGNVTMANISVTDTMTAPATQGNLSAINCPSPSLAPTVNETCTATYTVTQADLDHGSVHNSATASGTPPGSVIPITSGSSGVTVTGTQSPLDTVQKSSPTATYSVVGGTIAYNFLITNTGNVTLSNITVNDLMTAPATQAGLSAINCPSSSLAPDAHETCTATYTVTQADINNGLVHNSATASGTPPGSSTPVTSGSSGVTVTATLSPSVSVVTSSPTPSYSAAGTTIVYDFLVTNTGNVTLTNVTVDDTMAAPATQGNLSAITCPTTILAPGTSETCTANYVVTQADVNNGSVHTSATASGIPPGSSTPVVAPKSSVLAVSVTVPVPAAGAGSPRIPLLPIGLVTVGVGALVLVSRRRLFAAH